MPRNGAGCVILHGYWRSGTSYRVRLAFALKGDDALPPLPGSEDAPAGTAAATGDGLGQSTSADAFAG